MSSTVNPSEWCCPVCRKLFKEQRHFKQHHRCPRHRQCYDCCLDNWSGTPTGPCAPNVGPDQGTTSPQIDANDDQLAVHEEAPEAVDTGLDDLGWHDDNIAMEDASMDDVGTTTLDDFREDPSQNAADAAYNPDADLHTEILENFTRCVDAGDSTFAPLQPEHRAAIELMSVLDKAGGNFATPSPWRKLTQ